MQRTAWRTAGVLRWHPSPEPTVDDLLSGDVLNLVLMDMDKVLGCGIRRDARGLGDHGLFGAREGQQCSFEDEGFSAPVSEAESEGTRR